MQIKEIQKELNLTTIFVTHDQEEALELSDRIILMNKGKIMQNSSANNLYLLPECHFVASFIGSYNILSPKELDNLGLQHNFKKDMALRPETIEISNKGLKAKIKQKLLLGNVIRYLVKLQEIELKVDTLNFSIYSTFEVGDKIALRFNLSLAKELK